MYKRELIDIFTGVRDLSQSVGPYTYTMRASGFPFCPKEFVLATFLNPPAPKIDYYWLDHYAEVGHQQHGSLQKWLGRAQILFGDWKCWRCKNIVRDHLGPPTCCHQEMEFRENAYYDPVTGMTGHSDGVLQATADTKVAESLRRLYNKVGIPYAEPVMLEVKTRSSGYVQASKTAEWTHLLQGNVYANLFNLYYRPGARPQLDLWPSEMVPIRYILVHYVSRQNHRVWKSHLCKIMPQAFSSLQKDILYGKEMVEERCLPMGICTTPRIANDTMCPFAGVCFSPTLAKTLNLKEVA